MYLIDAVVSFSLCLSAYTGPRTFFAWQVFNLYLTLLEDVIILKRSSSNLLRLKRSKQKIPMQILQIYMGFWYLSCFSSSLCLHKIKKAYIDMLIPVIPEHVHGLSFCPNYTLCCHLGFSEMLYSLLMVEDDGTCNCTDGHNIKKQFVILCVGFGPCPFTSHFWIWMDSKKTPKQPHGQGSS